jgi:hypothetical protein
MPAETDLLDALGRTHPLLNATLEASRRAWEPELPPVTVAMGALASAFATGADAMSRTEIDEVARVVEQLMESEPGSTAVATGFLEALVHAVSRDPSKRKAVAALGRLAREYCRAYDEFTGAKSPGLE